jgi:hypothetical protein
VEYLLLHAEPAELVRLVDGLTGIDQAASMRGGGTLKLAASAIARDDSGRVDLDRILQSALMSHATMMSWLFDYDNRGDHDDFRSEMRGDSRVPLGGLKNVYEKLRGVPYRAVSVSEGEAGDVMQAIAAETAGGERVPALVAFGAPDALHWLTVEKIADNPEGQRGVYLRNPWGHDDGDGAPQRWPLPEGGGRVAMLYADFIAILHGAVLKG